MSFLQIKNLGLNYPESKNRPSSKSPTEKHKAALKDISLEVPAGSFLGLLGPNGSGKTSLLRTIAGFERPHQGSITIDGETVFRKNTLDPGVWKNPEQRHVGMVFQNLALFPHLKVQNNITFGLSSLPKKKKHQRLEELLDLLELRSVRECYGFELSGGLRQRVAIARALAPRPKLLLLDEPFSSLDLEISLSLSRKLKSILKDLGITAIMVSHNRSQALELAEHIAIMVEGEILEQGSPCRLYAQPKDYRVAAFLGESYFINCTSMDDGFMTPFGKIPHTHVYDLRSNRRDSQAKMGLKAESLTLVKCDERSHESLPPSSSLATIDPQQSLARCLEFKILGETFQGYYKLIRAKIFTGEILEFRLPSDHHYDLSQYRISLRNTKFCIYNALPK